jgi:hypothetical protein
MARPSRKKVPWPKLGDGKPIERYPDLEDKYHWARDEQVQRMAQLTEMLGIKTYKELAIALGGMLDPALTIVDCEEPKGRTTKRWRGPHGMQLVVEVKAVQDTDGCTLEQALKTTYDLRRKYRAERITFPHFRKNYYEAKKYTQRGYEARTKSSEA